MPLTPVNVGAAPNDGTGDTLRDANIKINANTLLLGGGHQTITPLTIGVTVLQVNRNYQTVISSTPTVVQALPVATEGDWVSIHMDVTVQSSVDFHTNTPGIIYRLTKVGVLAGPIVFSAGSHRVTLRYARSRWWMEETQLMAGVGPAIAALQAKDVTHDNQIAALVAKDVTHDNQIGTHSTQISALQLKDVDHDSQIAALQTKDQQHDTAITNLQNTNTGQATDITALQAMDLKLAGGWQKFTSSAPGVIPATLALNTNYALILATDVTTLPTPPVAQDGDWIGFDILVMGGFPRTVNFAGFTSAARVGYPADAITSLVFNNGLHRLRFQKQYTAAGFPFWAVEDTQWVQTLSGTITAIQSKDTAQDSAILSLQTKDTTHDQSIAALVAKDTAHDNAITALQGVDAGHDSAIAALQAKDVVHETEHTNIWASIDSLQVADGEMQAAIEALQIEDETNDTAILSLMAMDSKLAGGWQQMTGYFGIPALNRNYYTNTPGPWGVGLIPTAAEGDWISWIFNFATASAIDFHTGPNIVRRIGSAAPLAAPIDFPAGYHQATLRWTNGSWYLEDSALSASDADLAALQAKDATHDQYIEALLDKDSSLDADIDAVEAVNQGQDALLAVHSDQIAAIQVVSSEQDTAIQALQAKDVAQDAAIATLQDTDSTHTNQIASMAEQITLLLGGKQYIEPFTIGTSAVANNANYFTITSDAAWMFEGVPALDGDQITFWLYCTNPIGINFHTANGEVFLMGSSTNLTQDIAFSFGYHKFTLTRAGGLVFLEVDPATQGSALYVLKNSDANLNSLSVATNLWVSGTASINGGVSMAAGAVIGGSGGVNAAISFGGNYGAPAILLYDGTVGNKYGIGVTGGTFNSFIGAGATFAWRGGGGIDGPIVMQLTPDSNTLAVGNLSTSGAISGPTITALQSLGTKLAGGWQQMSPFTPGVTPIELNRNYSAQVSGTLVVPPLPAAPQEGDHISFTFSMATGAAVDFNTNNLVYRTGGIGGALPLSAPISFVPGNHVIHIRYKGANWWLEDTTLPWEIAAGVAADMFRDFAPPTLITNVSASGNPTGGITTAAKDTTFANFLLASVAAPSNAVPVVTDSKGNTWTAIPRKGTGTALQQYFYAANAIVGPGHTFTLMAGPATSSALFIAAFSGIATVDPIDLWDMDEITAGRAVATGPITPTQKKTIAVTAMSHVWNVGPKYIDGYNIIEQRSANAPGYGGALAWRSLDSITPVDASWRVEVGQSDFTAAVASILTIKYGPPVATTVSGAHMLMTLHKGDKNPINIYKDTAGTLPARLAGDKVALWRDPAHGISFTQADPARQPTLQFENGYPYLEFADDGATRFLSATWTYPGTAAAISVAYYSTKGTYNVFEGPNGALAPGATQRFDADGMSYPALLRVPRAEAFMPVPLGRVMYSIEVNSGSYYGFINGVQKAQQFASVFNKTGTTWGIGINSEFSESAIFAGKIWGIAIHGNNNVRAELEAYLDSLNPVVAPVTEPAIISSATGSYVLGSVSVDCGDTTGANFIYLAIGFVQGNTPVITDNKKNTYTLEGQSSYGTLGFATYVCKDPLTGVGHGISISNCQSASMVALSGIGITPREFRQLSSGGNLNTVSVTAGVSTRKAVAICVLGHSDNKQFPVRVSDGFTIIQRQRYNASLPGIELAVKFIEPGVPTGPTWRVNETADVNAWIIVSAYGYAGPTPAALPPEPVLLGVRTGTGGTHSCDTNPALDTGGAGLIVVHVARSDPGTLTDNYENSWTRVGPSNFEGGASTMSEYYYCINPKTGPVHSWIYSGPPGTGPYGVILPSIIVAAYSYTGGLIGAPYFVSNGAVSVTGLVTPTLHSRAKRTLLLAGFASHALGGTNPPVGWGFKQIGEILTASNLTAGSVLAHRIMTGGGSSYVNFSGPNAGPLAVSMLAFDVSLPGVSPILPPPEPYAWEHWRFAGPASLSTSAVVTGAYGHPLTPVASYEKTVRSIICKPAIGLNGFNTGRVDQADYTLCMVAKRPRNPTGSNFAYYTSTGNGTVPGGTLFGCYYLAPGSVAVASLGSMSTDLPFSDRNVDVDEWAFLVFRNRAGIAGGCINDNPIFESVGTNTNIGNAIGIGNLYHASGGDKEVEFAEVIFFDAALTDAQVQAVYKRSALRMRAVGISINSGKRDEPLVMLIASTSKGLAAAGGYTDPIDTTGARLIVINLGFYSAGTIQGVHDSFGNSYLPLAPHIDIASGAAQQLWYCENPQNGPGHQFQINGATIFASVQVAAFGGDVITVNPLDEESGGIGTGLGIDIGPIGQNSQQSLVIAGVAFSDAQPEAPGAPEFVMIGAEPYIFGQHFGSAMAFKISNSPVLARAHWDFVVPMSGIAAGISTFKLEDPAPPPPGALLPVIEAIVDRVEEPAPAPKAKRKRKKP